MVKDITSSLYFICVETISQQRLKSLEEALRMPVLYEESRPKQDYRYVQKAVSRKSNWLQVSPTAIPDGQTAATYYYDAIYIGTALGRVWKTEDGGRNWVAKSDQFTRYQQYVIGFKDLGIQLWEVHKYSNDLLVFNEAKSSFTKEPITTITKSNRIAKKVTEEIKVCTEGDHLNEVDDNAKLIFVILFIRM